MYDTYFEKSLRFSLNYKNWNHPMTYLDIIVLFVKLFIVFTQKIFRPFPNKLFT